MFRSPYISILIKCKTKKALHFIINIYYYKKIHINIPKFWLEISKLSIPVVISFGIVLAINKIVSLNGIIDVLFTGILFTIIFIPLMWLLGMNNSEKELFMGPLKLMGRKVKKGIV